MDKSNEIFDEDITNVINTLRITLHSFKNLEAANSVLKQKNKLLSEELESLKKNENSCKQDEILKEIAQNLRKNSKILEERMANLQAELKVATQLNRKYKKDIDIMEEKYIHEIQTINEDNAKEMKRLKSELQNKMETINLSSVSSNEEYNRKIVELKAQNNTKVTELKLEHNETVEEYENGIKKLNEKIFEIISNYDKMKEKCNNLEKKLSASRQNNAKSENPKDDEVFANLPNHFKSLDKPTKSNIEPSFLTKITKPIDEANKTVEVVPEKPKKRKLFNPRSEIIFLEDQ